jgi:hypothetical protein
VTTYLPRPVSKFKPFAERLVPGTVIQIQNKAGNTLVDFNPYVGYRFTGRMTTGVGWNQRTAYNTKGKNFNPAARIYGPRIFGEFKLWKGFSPRGEVELMNTAIPPFNNSSLDASNREWVCGVFFGIKKQYKFFKNVRGTAMVMARLSDSDHKSPYVDVINARFGFEFPHKIKRKKVQ